MKVPKVLVVIVTYEAKDYVWDKFYRNINNLDYPNFEVLLVDNSATKKYYSKLKRRTKNNPLWTIKHVNRGKTSREAQAKSLNKAREQFLKGDYDYFMTIESDLIPPVDIIERLINHKVGVVGCMYNIGYVDSKSQPVRPCLFGLRANNGEGRTFNYPPDEGFAFFGNGLMKVHGCGFGTTIIRRDLIEKFKFSYDLGLPVKHSDVLFYKDLHNEGHTAYVDTDIIIPHYNSDWNKVLDK